MKTRKFRHRRKRYYGKVTELRRSEPIMRDSDWRSIYRFERRHGVLRGTKFPRI
jgi:hypothetical protein